MNKKTQIIIGIGILALGLFVLPYAFAQQDNDYRAFSATMSAIRPTQDGNNITTSLLVYYIPIYPSATYTLTAVDIEDVKVDFSKPNTIQSTVAKAIQEEGYKHGWNVTKVILPSFNQVVP